jgi:transcriptional regulator with XRE-family HTH domain
MYSKEAFADRLKALRVSNHISQIALAKTTGVGKTVIGLIEVGNRAVSVDALVKLCDYFGVSADYLLGLSDSPERR